MKLRSKIASGVLIVLLLSLTVCCSIIISVSKRNILDRMVDATKLEVDKLADNLQPDRFGIEDVKEKLTEKSMLKYYFFQQTQYSDADTEYVLLSENETIYNNSGLNTAEILELDNKYETVYQTVHLYENDYIVAGKKITIGTRLCQLYVVRNITGVFHQIHQLVGVCILTALLVSVIAGICILLFLKIAFHPLELLKEEADAISEGEYRHRISIRGKDELASLSHSFNKMAESVERHIKEVETTSEARNRMIHALSHEMRTPVTAICGYAYALRSMKMKQEQQEEALEFIDLEAKRLERLSAKLTSLVGLSSDKIQLNNIKISDIKYQLEMLFSENSGIKLQAEEGTIRGDQDLLLMLITNLCDNATKAGATKIDVKISSEGMWIKDNGKGITKEEQEHIFEAFYQGDNSRNQEGFGLGLSLCQKIAELHNTKLYVDSEPGKGTCFYLYNTLATS